MRISDWSSDVCSSDLVGRIATSLLAGAPRPLRLCYAGQVVKLRASQLRPAREMLQVGAELIGSDSVAAAREIVTDLVCRLLLEKKKLTSSRSERRTRRQHELGKAVSIKSVNYEKRWMMH